MTESSSDGAVRRAQARLWEQVLGLVQSTVPADDEPARNFVAQYEQRFSEVPDDNGPVGHEVTREHDFRPDDDEQGYLR